MSSKQDLLDSIQQYSDQLSQVQQALAAAVSSDDTERMALENLKADLEELLKLTQETLEHEYGTERSTESPANKIDDEFALFMSEINGLDESSNPPKEQNEDESAAFKELVGNKCSAPHTHKWGSKSYHNAMICSVDTSNLEEVMAKVLFINPTHQEMVPCNYYLEGECRFDDEKCRFSHGAVVALHELKEYHEPQFDLLRNKGGKVLAKQKNRIWSKGMVKDTNFANKTCKIQMEEGKHEVELAFEDILPLGTTREDDNDELSEDSNLSSDESEDDLVAVRQAQIIQKSLLNPVGSQRLGEWEKHTRGMGSRIMQKMGYVVGAGLGSQGEGIVVPVSAQVLPQGKSLDYCMQLREQANGDSNLFSVEKKLQRQKRIQEKQAAKQYAQRKERKDVFTFMNSEIFGSEGNSSTSSSSNSGRRSIGTPQEKVDLQNCSSKNLNIASLKLSEQCRRLEADVKKLAQSLSNHKAGSKIHDSLKKQITDKKREIDQLQKTEYSISREQQLRSDKRKMTVF